MSDSGGQIQDRVIDHLDELGVPYRVLPCDPSFADTAQFCERYGIDPAISANSILIASKRPTGRFALCVALATTRLDVNHRVRELLDVRKLSFASPDLTMEKTGMMIGGVTPFGLPKDLAVYVDSQVMSPAEVVFGGGSRSCKIVIAPAVFHEHPTATVVERLAA